MRYGCFRDFLRIPVKSIRGSGVKAISIPAAKLSH